MLGRSCEGEGVFSESDDLCGLGTEAFLEGKEALVGTAGGAVRRAESSDGVAVPVHGCDESFPSPLPFFDVGLGVAEDNHVGNMVPPALKH